MGVAEVRGGEQDLHDGLGVIELLRCDAHLGQRPVAARGRAMAHRRWRSACGWCQRRVECRGSARRQCLAHEPGVLRQSQGQLVISSSADCEITGTLTRR